MAFAQKYGFAMCEALRQVKTPREWLAQHFNELTEEQQRMYAQALQCFFGHTYVLCTAATNASLFREFCRASMTRKDEVTGSTKTIEAARSAFSQSAVAIVDAVHRKSSSMATCSMSFRGMRLKYTEDIQSVLQKISQTTNAGPFSCSKRMSVAMRFVDPRQSEASLPTMRLQRQRLNMQEYQCGLLLIYDGIMAVDVSTCLD